MKSKPVPMLPFRTRLTLEQRRREYQLITMKRPELVPIIVERDGRDAPRMDKEKFLVPDDLTAAQFAFVLRRRLHMTSSEALFLLCNGLPLSGDTTLSQVRARTVQSDDGFLYVSYSLENAFGRTSFS
jgi:hypothetical protein